MSNYYLPYQDLKDTAEEILLKEPGIAQQIPIDIDFLAESLDFTIIPTRSFKESITKEAFLAPFTKEVYIDYDLLINQNTENRYRFAIAHEIAHYYLHLEYYKDYVGQIENVETWIKVSMKALLKTESLKNYHQSLMFPPEQWNYVLKISNTLTRFHNSSFVPETSRTTLRRPAFDQPPLNQ